MNVLLTGGSGFIGRHVALSLRAAGHGVRVACRTGATDAVGSSVVVGNIGPDTEWGDALDGIDAVVHLAGRAHVMHDSTRLREEFQHTNTGGTLQLARAAAAAGVGRFVFMSTIKVNGEATRDRPFRPDDEPQAIDPYGRSKCDAEAGLRQLLPGQAVVIRPPLVHGPGARGNLARLCRLAQLGAPVPFGSIHNRRDIVGVDNLAHLVERCLWHPAAAGSTFLVSDGEPLSTSQLYCLIAEAMGRRALLVKVPVWALRMLAMPLGMVGEVDRLTQSLEVDISRTRELLDWVPPVSLADGVARMAQAFARAPS